MNERTQNIAVGATTLAGLVGFAAILMLFGYAPRIAEEGYQVRVRMADAAGLSEGSRVLLSGIQVGRINSVAFDTDPARPGGVVAVLLINKGAAVPRGVRARTTATLLGGSASLELSSPPAAPGVPLAYLATDGHEVIEGESSTLASDIQGSLQRVESKFEQVSADLTRIATKLSADVDDAAHSFHDLSAQWTEVGRNVRGLTDPRTPEDVDKGQAAGNLSSLVARADARVRELHSVLDGVNQWVHDPELRDNVHKTAANAAGFTQQAQQTAAQIGALATKYLAVADDLSAAVASLRQTLDQVNRGQGTVGKLLKDPGLYDNLNDSAVRLGQSIDELKKLLEKARTEGLPLKY
jgi:phospholipid/cholesterol/gamma-HCH transport system substrate-binding protein